MIHEKSPTNNNKTSPQRNTKGYNKFNLYKLVFKTGASPCLKILQEFMDQVTSQKFMLSPSHEHFTATNVMYFQFSSSSYFRTFFSFLYWVVAEIIMHIFYRKWSSITWHLLLVKFRDKKKYTNRQYSTRLVYTKV